MQYCKPQVLLGKGYHFTIEGIRKGYLFSLLVYERVARRASTFIPEMTCREWIARQLNLFPTFTANIILSNKMDFNVTMRTDVMLKLISQGVVVGRSQRT